jgi:hypothetical protein
VGNSQSTEKVNSGASVLGGNDADGTERIHKPTRDVAEIPDRSRGEDDHGSFSQSLTGVAGSLG